LDIFLRAVGLWRSGRSCGDCSTLKRAAARFGWKPAIGSESFRPTDDVAFLRACRDGARQVIECQADHSHLFTA
jgi:hypothetical protein